ncbi:hypothetical protein G195_009451, partial [Phytophthora kernoviae 00238/432]
RNGEGDNAAVHLIHFGLDGAATEDIKLGGTDANERAPHLASIGSGGMLAMWEGSSSGGDLVEGSDRTIYAQVLDSTSGKSISDKVTVDGSVVGNRYQALKSFPDGSVAYLSKGKTDTSVQVFTVVEGTGHTGVGSIVDCNNARIAAELGVDMVLVANGGLGSAFDDLALNYSMCKVHGVKIRGVILNKVRRDRVAMLREYFPKAMKLWGEDVPLIGIVPNLPALSDPSMLDFEGLFKTQMLTSRSRRFQQYSKTTLVTAGLRRFLSKLTSPEFDNALFVTHVSRNDIILGFLSHAQTFELTNGIPYGGGLILTGSPSEDQPQDYLMNIIKHAQAPILYVPMTTFAAMEKITHFTAKFNPTDENRVHTLSSSVAVRGVTFDLDDTLWCGKTVIHKATSAFHAFLTQETPQLAEKFPPAVFDTLLSDFQRSLPDHAHDYTFLRKYTLRYCVKEVGAQNLQLGDAIKLETYLEEAFQAFLVPRSQPDLFDGVEQLFQGLEMELKASHTGTDSAPLLGVITNGNCEMDGLPKYFQDHMSFMVSAELVGTPKPSRVIFDAAVAKFPASYSRQHLVHVGDHYECDVEGAKRAGLRTIWVNAMWSKPDALTQADLTKEDAEQYAAADAIVKEVNAVLSVVKRWNMLAKTSLKE